jgi:hypothetical protein
MTHLVSAAAAAKQVFITRFFPVDDPFSKHFSVAAFTIEERDDSKLLQLQITCLS